MSYFPLSLTTKMGCEVEWHELLGHVTRGISLNLNVHQEIFILTCDRVVFAERPNKKEAQKLSPRHPLFLKFFLLGYNVKIITSEGKY